MSGISSGLLIALFCGVPRRRWTNTPVVDDMIGRGAEESDADFEKIVKYLAKN